MMPRAWRREPSVLVSHPGVQQSYETVAGLQQAGMLGRFITSVYDRDSEDGRERWDWLPEEPRRAIVSRLRRRRHPAIDSALVHTIGGPFMAARGAAAALDAVGLRRFHGVEQVGDAAFDSLTARALSECGATQVHAFEGAALRTLRAARKRGLRTVLDVPSAHERNLEVAAAEARAAGRRLPPRFGSSQRVREERDAADVILSPSGFVARCLVANGVDPLKIIGIPFGADPDVFAPPPGRDSSGRFVLLDVGSINYRKGTRYLLQAWGELALRDAELVLAGEPDEAGRDTLREYHGLYRHLGHVPWPDLPELFRSASAFVLPSLAEGSALVTYMALASALPVIVTEDAGSVANDGREGWIVPSRDVEALKAKILHLYERRSEGEAMGRAGRRLIGEHYTWRHYHRRIAALHRAIHGGDDVAQAVADADSDRTNAPTWSRAA